MTAKNEPSLTNTDGRTNLALVTSIIDRKNSDQMCPEKGKGRDVPENCIKFKQTVPKSL